MKKSAQTGFTLIELMVVVALLGVLATMGVPALQEYTANSRLRSQTNDIVVSIQRARNEAIENRTQPGVHVTAEPSSANVQRLVVWIDGGDDLNDPADGVVNGVIDGGDINTSIEVLQIFEFEPSVNVTLFNYDANISLAEEGGINAGMDGRTLSFRSNGSLRISNDVNAAQISLSDHRPGKGRCLNVRATGQVVLRNVDGPCTAN